MFPVGQVGFIICASQEVGIFFFFFFPDFIFFYKLECTGWGGVKRKKLGGGDVGGESSSRPFLAHPAGGQETTFYFRVA